MPIAKIYNLGEVKEKINYSDSLNAVPQLVHCTWGKILKNMRAKIPELPVISSPEKSRVDLPPHHKQLYSLDKAYKTAVRRHCTSAEQGRHPRDRMTHEVSSVFPQTFSAGIICGQWSKNVDAKQAQLSHWTKEAATFWSC